MLKPSEDRTLAFFESLILEPNGIQELRDGFFNGVKESFISTQIENPEDDIILAFDTDEYNHPITYSNDFTDYLKSRIVKEVKITKELIISRATKLLSNSSPNNSFFLFTEVTLMELENKTNNGSYRIINDAIIELIEFFFSKYYKFHNFSTEYKKILPTNKQKSRSDKISLSFKWKEENRINEIEFLFNKLMQAEPPFINTSKEIFIKAFTDKPLEKYEHIKWLCANIKNKRKISKFTLVTLLQSLFDKEYIVSDQNDFTKTVENVFSYPNGDKLRDIKVTRKVKSKNPSRIQEIQDILGELYIIS